MRPRLYGLLAEFESPQLLFEAILHARREGYREMDAYTPFPIEEISELIHPAPSRLPLIVLAGGIVGCLAGYVLQSYTAVVDYPLNIGGRPLHSWPMFIPIMFELTILAAGVAAVLGMFVLNRLPMPYHPVFHAPRFVLASRERYFLAIQAIDPRFDAERTRAFLEGLSPHEVVDVEP